VPSCAAGANPFIDFISLKFPRPADTVRRHVSLVDPRIYGVLAHAEMRRNFFDREPRLSHVVFLVGFINFFMLHALIRNASGKYE